MRTRISLQPLSIERVTALVGIALAVPGLVLGAGTSRGAWAMEVDAFVRSTPASSERRVRVEGTLVHGTLAKRDSPCAYRFALEHGGVKLDVEYASCALPDTICDVDGVEVRVVVEGHLEHGTLVADGVTARCPSKYDPTAKTCPAYAARRR